MQISQKKKLTAGLSVTSNIFLSVIKIFAGYLSGSISIISEAIHSLSDCMASFIALFSVVKSSKPADSDHPFGHGKYEDMSGFIEGLLIIVASFYIIYEATRKIIIPSSAYQESILGIIVMLVAVIVNIIVSSLLFKTAHEADSISLLADAEHLRVDVYSSFGVLLGLILIKITGYNIIDSFVAILVAMFIFKTGYNISKKSWENLLDHSLPIEDIKKIEDVVLNFNNVVKLKKDSIRARKIGAVKDIDLILQFPCETTICDCHKICDEIENKISAVFGTSTISIHSEPVCHDKNCENECSRKTKTLIKN